MIGRIRYSSAWLSAAARMLAAIALAIALMSVAPAAGAQEVVVSAQAVAPVDLTGTWVSVVSEDWAWRMRTPPKGDYASLPLTSAAIAAADQWDPASADSCLGYGAVAGLRNPTRVQIEWASENTLSLHIDNGDIRRVLYFADAPVTVAPSLEGISRARWLLTSSVTGSGATGGILTSALAQQAWASLEVITTDLAPGWIRTNGVPYSEAAILTEYFDWFSDAGQAWFTVTIMLEDPVNLTEPLVISSNFRREQDARGWSPRPCSGRSLPARRG